MEKWLRAAGCGLRWHGARAEDQAPSQNSDFFKEPRVLTRARPRTDSRQVGIFPARRELRLLGCFETQPGSRRGSCCCALPSPIILDSVGDWGQTGPQSENTAVSMNALAVGLLSGCVLGMVPDLILVFC